MPEMSSHALSNIRSFGHKYHWMNLAYCSCPTSNRGNDLRLNWFHAIILAHGLQNPKTLIANTTIFLFTVVWGYS